jgi:prepilin-type N-terminal cleavage/methylation domain-containing protein
VRKCSGFTLIEVVVTLAIVALLVLATAPLASDWVYRSTTHTALTQVTLGFNVAKALALQNPNAVAVPTAAAGMKITTDGTTTTVYVCTGSSAGTGCTGTGCTAAALGASVKWCTTYSGLVTTSLNALAATTTTSLTLDFDNRGEPSAATAFTFTRGNSSNNETVTLY